MIPDSQSAHEEAVRIIREEPDMHEQYEQAARYVANLADAALVAEKALRELIASNAPEHVRQAIDALAAIEQARKCE